MTAATQADFDELKAAIHKAIAEHRRLRAINAELLGALKDACLDYAQYGDQPPAKWLSVIAKIEEQPK